ncbi:MAG: helix-turn-helix transcriptional regulator [Kurthia sp.]|nr:helix-turn-helix transcriptional regulator [Candidatus Kurthia equi]
MSINKRIVLLREKKNWSQKEFAQRMKMNQSVMNRIESGGRPIKNEELSKIALVLECTSDYLLGIENRNVQNSPIYFEQDTTLQQWYHDLAHSKPEELKKLYKIWEIMKESNKM